MIITIGTTGLPFGLKEVDVKLPGASLGAMDIVKCTSLICGEVFVKDYAAYKKWIKEWYIKNFIAHTMGDKIYTTSNTDPF